MTTWSRDDLIAEALMLFQQLDDGQRAIALAHLREELRKRREAEAAP